MTALLSKVKVFLTFESSRSEWLLVSILSNGEPIFFLPKPSDLMPSHGYYMERMEVTLHGLLKSGKLEVVLSIIRRIALPAYGGSVTASAFFALCPPC